MYIEDFGIISRSEVTTQEQLFTVFILLFAFFVLLIICLYFSNREVNRLRDEYEPGYNGWGR